MVWVNPEQTGRIHAAYPNLRKWKKRVGDGGFVNGRTVEALETTVSTCTDARLPPRLFVVTHAGMPGKGVRAGIRGGADDFAMQLQLQNHLEPLSRRATPFVTAYGSRNATEEARLLRVAADCELDGRTGIKILEVDPRAKCWNYTRHCVWNALDLFEHFELRRVRPKRNVFLIEQRIPRKAITSFKTLEHVKQEKDLLWRAAWNRASKARDKRLKGNKRRHVLYGRRRERCDGVRPGATHPRNRVYQCCPRDQATE